MKNKEKTIYLSNVESSALVIQAMLVGTRMELLDLLDYAKENSIDSVPVQHIQEEVIGLRELEDEEYHHREKCYLEAHENNPISPWVSPEVDLPELNIPVLVCVHIEYRSMTTFPKPYIIEINNRVPDFLSKRMSRELGEPYTDKYGFLNHGAVVYRVLFWAPIPELPKGGEI